VIEHRTVGLEKIGAAFRELFVGANVGKAVVQVAERDPFPVASK
jgi:NADPH-dependent curcumin reductase CurA